MANSKLNKLTKNGVTYDLQDKEISDKLAGVTGIIKDNAGTLSAAVAGTDYGYPLLKGAGAPSTSTIASVGQHYFDTSAIKAPYEYVCVAAGSSYTWIEAGGSGAGSNLIADEYSASSSYAIGDVIIYEGILYKCNTTISSGEAWNASHWTATTIEGLISELQTTIEAISIKADNALQIANTNGLISNDTATWLQIPRNSTVDYALRRIPVKSKLLKTSLITTDMDWIVPVNIASDVTVRLFGGGGAGGSNRGGGGGGGHMKTGTFTLNANDVIHVTIGNGGVGAASGGNGGAGGTTSFGSYLSAAGGSGGYGSGGNGGAGGSGGGGGDAGGNGSYGGGGGGSLNQAGGNGGTYGGGGGSGCGTSPASGGAGGTYGGAGGKGADVHSSLYTSPTAATEGVNTIGLGLEFEGQGLAGSIQGSMCRGGAGGGGYGGNGGNGGYGYRHPDSSATSYGGGGGGGGYGANGGAGGYGWTGMGNLSHSGGGGGGYGGAGGDSGCNTQSGANDGGGGGGGYGINSKGGNGGAGSSGSPQAGSGFASGGGGSGSHNLAGGAGASGICILTYYVIETLWPEEATSL